MLRPVVICCTVTVAHMTIVHVEEPITSGTVVTALTIVHGCAVSVMDVAAHTHIRSAVFIVRVKVLSKLLHSSVSQVNVQ